MTRALAIVILAACTSNGARAPHASPPPDPVRPLFGGASCTATTDCAKGETCFAPDFRPSGGGAAPSCEDDDCTRPRRPDKPPPPCSDPAAEPCPQNHRCGASGGCERLACSDAAACDVGVCWNGHCYAHGADCAPDSYCCPP
jgi:hypothetical protein|nr:hypothetical protein [Kofleriaceae bacterium]